MRRVAMVVVVMTALVLAIVGTGSIAMAKPDGNDFVCPVIKSQGIANNPNAVPLGEGTYTIAQPTQVNFLDLPDQATNGGGYGVPGDHTGDNAQAEPGDRDYTAIWNGDATPDP